MSPGSEKGAAATGARTAGEGGGEIGAGARRRAAVEVYSRNEAALRRTASRFSLCADDADDALQRALEILLRKAPSDDPRELVRWTQTVVKHEALAVRAERERILSGPAASSQRQDWVAMLPTEADGPPERAERHEAVARSREALQALKPAELRALTLLAEGYSYAEIGEITNWSQTKINRCLAEGRERFRALLLSSEAGRRCRELRPLLSAFADGEAGAAETATLREHLRACPHCRATLRAYRAAPAAAAALAPTLPLSRSLLDRAHDALAGLAARFGSDDTAMTGVASAGGSRGAGVAALAKLAAICVGTASGAAACVATGVVPAPLAVDAGQAAPHLSRPLDRQAKASYEREIAPVYESEPEPAVEPTPAAEAEPPHEDKQQAKREAKERSEASEPVAEAAPEPETEEGAVEYAPPPPAPEPAPTSSAAPASSGAGSPSGEFGP